MYGPATTLVYTTGHGHPRVHPRAGHRRVPPDAPRHPIMPRAARPTASTRATSTRGTPGSAPTSSTCAADKASGRPYSLRYSGAMVADVHRTLARRRHLHVPRRLHRSGQAEAQAPPALRGGADGHASSSRRGAAPARARTGAGRLAPPSTTSAPRSSSAAPTTWRRPKTSTGAANAPADQERTDHHGHTGEGDPELVREREPRTRTNLARMLNHGTLAGTGRMVILPVDQGFEHGPARSFAVNPPAYDPLYHFQPRARRRAVTPMRRRSASSRRARRSSPARSR